MKDQAIMYLLLNLAMSVMAGATLVRAAKACFVTGKMEISSYTAVDYLQLTQRCRAQVAVSSRSVPGRNGGAEMHGWSHGQTSRRNNTYESVSKTDSQSTSFRYLRESRVNKWGC